MIEFAIVLPFLALLAFGTAEMGMAWVAHNRVEGAVSTAARVGASSGGVPEADVNILSALRTALPAESLDNLDRVIIFKPTNDDGGIPNGCMKDPGESDQGGVSAWCNTYTGATVQSFDETGPDPLGSADDFWRGDSLHRPDSLAGPPEDIGVWVRTTYNAKTGTFFDDMTITRTSIYRLQPDNDG